MSRISATRDRASSSTPRAPLAAKAHAGLSSIAKMADILADGIVSGKEVGGVIGTTPTGALVGAAVGTGLGAGPFASVPFLGAVETGVMAIGATHFGAALGPANGGSIGGAMEEA